MVGTSFEFDAVLDLCGNKQRRIVLAVLAEQKRPLTMDDLTEAIVEHNHHTPLTEVSGETVARIKACLHHSHIPKLVEAEVVGYDPERQLVEPTEQLDRIEPHFLAILEADPGLATPLSKEDSTRVTEPREEAEWTY